MRTTNGMSFSETEVNADVKMARLSANCCSVKRRFSNVERMEGHSDESVCRRPINSCTHIYLKNANFSNLLIRVVNQLRKQIQNLLLYRRRAYLHSKTSTATTERISSKPETREDASAMKSNQRNWLSKREITESELASSSEYSVTFSNTHFTIPDCKESTRISKRQTLSWLIEEKGISDYQEKRIELPSSPSGTTIGFINFLSSSAEFDISSTSTSPFKHRANHA